MFFEAMQPDFALYVQCSYQREEYKEDVYLILKANKVNQFISYFLPYIQKHFLHI